MKHIKYISIILLISLTTIHCKNDFLEVPDKSRIAREVYVVDLKTTQDFLNGVYISLAMEVYEEGNVNTYPDVISDNAKLYSYSSDRLSSQYKWSQTLDDGQASNMSKVWILGYRLIRSCSFVILKANEYHSQNPEKADNMIAQALVIRAMTHFVIANIFAQSYNYTANASHPGIPYITTHDYTVPVKSRGTVNEVYNGMIKDLTEALPLFDGSSTGPLTMSPNAAKALLARIYLYKEDYQAAKNLAREVAQAIPIMTGNDYPSKLFTNNETEAIFQLYPSSASIPKSHYETYFQGFFYAIGYFYASDDVVSLLTSNPQDTRNSWITLDPSRGWMVTKFPQNVIPEFTYPTNSYYETLLRSSEMYLIAAESYAKLNKEDSARYYLDAIRTRAFPAAVPSTATGPALLDSIYLERRKEFVFEGQRMYDLLRWKKGVKRTDPLDPSVRELPYPSNMAIAPIPDTDVFEQNPGYH